MGVAADHLLVHVTAHVRDVKLARVGGYLRLEHHLEQHVAQLLAQVRHIARLDGVYGLVGLLYHVVRDGLVRLLAIPGAAVGGAQSLDGGREGIEVGVGARRDVRDLLLAHGRPS